MSPRTETVLAPKLDAYLGSIPLPETVDDNGSVAGLSPK